MSADGSGESQGRSGTPTSEPISERSRTFGLPAGEIGKEPRFITEAGTYFIAARTDSEQSASAWMGFSDGHGGVTGGYVSVTIFQSGGVHVGKGFDD